MIRTIVIDGFKSVRQRQELPVAPLTVLTGANSSGKSSVLQSILLSAQSLQSSVHSASVVLNGHIERLGRFSDIVSATSKQHPITLGFDLVPDPEEDIADDFAFIRQSMEMHPFTFLPKGTFKSICCEYSFLGAVGSQPLATSDLEPIVESTMLKVAWQSHGKTSTVSLSAHKSDEPPEKRAQKLGLDSKEYLDHSEELSYDVQEQGESAYAYRGLRESKDHESRLPKGVRLFHFLPFRETDVHEEIGWTTDEIVQALSDANDIGSGYLAWRAEQLLSDARSQGAFNSRLGEQLRVVTRSVLDSGISLSPREEKKMTAIVSSLESDMSAKNVVDMMRAFSTLSRKATKDLAARFALRKKELREAIRNERPDHLVVDMLMPHPLLAGAAAYTVHFFSEQVKYVGPLREQPRAVYPLSGSIISPRDVGFRGENVAAVLHNFGAEEIRNIRPSGLHDSMASPEIASEPLLDAVKSWLAYLGVADTLRTEDSGTEGYKLYAAPPSSGGDHDLTHVGVGVSQVLPILVQALMSSRNSLLLFEQPELHLHPRVQSRLADFFYAMTVLGKQCIVETHSEYMVERLRYLHAAAPGSSMAERVSLYFVELTPEGSTFRRMPVDEYGGIQDWPDGFFDESLRLASDIAHAGLAKSRQKGRNGQA